MSIDKSILDPMLNPFRGMMQDVESRKLTGKNVDSMRRVLTKMEQLGEEMSDVVAFTTKLSAENLYLEFSNSYSAALSEAATPSSSAKSSDAAFDDDSMLANTVKNYEASLASIESNPDFAHLLPPLKKSIEIGKSGVSYPVFLRMCEEQGLFDEMKHGAQRPTIESDLKNAEKICDPVRAEMYKKLLDAHDALCKKNPFGVIDYTEFEMLRFKITHEYEPKINTWKTIVRQWERLISLTVDWLDAFTSFAPYDERWKDAAGAAKTQENIAFAQECNPGLFKAWESMFAEYFNLKWGDIFTHESFKNEVAAVRVAFSDERIKLAQATYDFIKSGTAPSAELIAQSEDIYNGKRVYRKEYLERGV